MDVAVTQTSTFNPTEQITTDNTPDENGSMETYAINADEQTFKLGLWLSGLESFLNIRNHYFAEQSHNKASTRDWTKEFRLTHSTLLLCSKLNYQLAKVYKNTPLDISDETNDELKISSEEIYELSLALKDCVLLNEGLLRAAPLKFGEWTAWCNFLSDKFKTVKGFEKLIKIAEKIGEDSLPETFDTLLKSDKLTAKMKADLQLVLPRFAKILEWLGVIGEMLERDEPLKPSLLIFSRIYEQINEMMSYINNLLLRYPNEEDELFGSLDGASYTASIELRKVYNHELTGLAEMRISPSIYAKIETAYSLLNDSFQLTLINFAQVIEPEIEPNDIFPSMKIKYEQSKALRQTMWDILQNLREAEQKPDEFPMDSLHADLRDFLKKGLTYLFYKDRETVERFIEEVLITRNKKDLVPILHRFGAYLETLFGQVNMRVVLAGEPFEYPQGMMPQQDMGGGFF